MNNLFDSIKNILIFCSGADKETLEETKLGAEESKYATIGVIIILTTALACCSGGCAAHKFFGGNNHITLVVVMFWGTFIFFLERYFMMSTKKFKGSGNPMDDFLNNLTTFILPVVMRISFSIVLSWFISFPLEAQIFKSSINTQIRLEDKIFADGLRNKDKSENAPQLADFNEKISGLEKEKQAKLSAISISEEEYRKELKTGYGDRAVKREKLVDKLREEL
jgi:Domain of unknown function (DUF4407)